MSLPTNPYPLGNISPGADFATLSKPVSANLSAELAAGEFGSLSITAPSTNNANIYICNTAAPPDKTNYTNVMRILAGGESYSVESPTINTIFLRGYFIGADDADQLALGEVGRR